MGDRNQQSTEDSILNGIMSATGDDFSDSPNPILDDAGFENQTVPETEKQDEVQDQNPNEEVVDQKPEPQQKSDKKPEPNKTRLNDRGDVVDEQGKVIARAGGERRLHIANERMKDEVRTASTRIQELEKQVEQNKTFADLPRQLGLTAEQVSDGFRMTRKFQDNPAEAIKELISRALGAGVELRQIIDDEFIPNISMKATTDLLDARLKPAQELIDAQRQARESEQYADKAQQEARRFIDDYYDRGADVHASSGDLARMVMEIREETSRQGRTLDPYSCAELALERIHSFCLKHGLDPMQPIAPQVQARREAQTKQPNGGSSSNGRGRVATPQSSRPIPNGGGRSAATEPASPFASPDDDFGSIIRGAMKEQGYNFN